MQDASITTDLESKINLNVLFRLNCVTAGSGEFEAAPKEFAQTFTPSFSAHEVLEDPNASEQDWLDAYHEVGCEPRARRNALYAILDLLRGLTERI